MDIISPDERLVFFGDTHLSPEDPARIGVVCAFLDRVCAAATRVFCVGDLFDFWLGPAHARRPDFAPVLDALRRLAESGVKTSFIHGNRDFTVSRTFVRMGIAVHRRGCSLQLPGSVVHVCHGDLFCTGDVRYQRMRRVIRSLPARSMFLALPMRWREPLAQRLRGTSRKEVASKDREVMGIVPSAVERCFATGVDTVICGHVHEQARVDYDCDGTLFTLGDWDGTGGSYLEWAGGQFAFARYELEGETT